MGIWYFVAAVGTCLFSDVCLFADEVKVPCTDRTIPVPPGLGRVLVNSSGAAVHLGDFPLQHYAKGIGAPPGHFMIVLSCGDNRFKENVVRQLPQLECAVESRRLSGGSLLSTQVCAYYQGLMAERALFLSGDVSHLLTLSYDRTNISRYRLQSARSKFRELASKYLGFGFKMIPLN